VGGGGGAGEEQKSSFAVLELGYLHSSYQLFYVLLSLRPMIPKSRD
jgi:hypothetical protein